MRHYERATIVTADEHDRLPITLWHLKNILPFTMRKTVMKQCSAVSACSQFDKSEIDVFVRLMFATVSHCGFLLFEILTLRFVALSPKERCSFRIH